MDVEKMARNVYPYILGWIKTAKKSKIEFRGKPEPIEKVCVIPDEEFGGIYDAFTISYMDLKLCGDEKYYFEKLLGKYGYGIFLSDKIPKDSMKKILIHELVHLAGIYEHGVKIGGYVYSDNDELEDYLVEKFKSKF